MTNTVQVISLFGGVFSFIIALGQILIKNKQNKNYLLALILFSFSVIQIISSKIISGTVFQLSFLNYYYIPFIFFLGPAMYTLFFQLSSNINLKIKTGIILFIPGLFLLLAFPITEFFELKIFNRPAFTYFLVNNSQVKIAEKLMITGFSINILYFIFILIKGFNLVKFSLKQKHILIFSFYIIVLSSVLVAGIALLAYIIAAPELIYISTSSVTFILILVYFFSQRYPQFFQDLEIVVRNAKYQKTTLKDFDLEQIEEHLRALMKMEKLYLNENLSLSNLSENLDLSSHQLSEFLNNYLKTNFSSFVNSYRIEEAKNLLVLDPESSILSIAYKVGFNSKSAFNAAFIKQTKLSPSGYQNKFSNSSLLKTDL